MPNSHHPSRRFGGRKLLVASIGVATVNYAVACTAGPNLFTTSANLLAPPVIDAAVDHPSDGSGVDAGKDDVGEVGR